MTVPANPGSSLTKEQYKQALLTEGVTTDRSIDLLGLLYDAPNCEATAPQLAAMLGYPDFAPVNALIGKLGKRIADALSVDIAAFGDYAGNTPGWWRVVADGESRPEGYTWSLKPALFDAMVELGLLQGQDPRLYPEVVAEPVALVEGRPYLVAVNTYERSSVARARCIEHYGTRCTVCDIDFGEFYGAIGQDFIHVHHVVELASIGGSYRVDPVADLRPVCPNCHSMLHRTKPAMTVDELRGVLEVQSPAEPEARSDVQRDLRSNQ